mgnify:CR=1 FL=1
MILEIDHIIPVSKGGDNSIMNLVTSCRDCNRGKTDKELSDDSAIKKQKRQIDELQERREQMEMMIAWRKELLEQKETEVDYICYLYEFYTEFSPNSNGKSDIRKLIRRFGFDEVCIATEMSIAKYYFGTEKSWNMAFQKVGGICYNMKKARDANAEPDS